jgi:NADP-dependent 3-hydroxy acid dehydrogenase YdfG
MASPFWPSLTQVWHGESYPAISPSRPELSTAGKEVVVTGGASGIGANITRAFAAAGSTKIAVMARREENLRVTKNDIERRFAGTEILTLATDITNRQQFDDAFAKVAEAFGKIDIFVSAAGYLADPAAVLAPECDLDNWWLAFNTNVLGVVQSARAFARHAAAAAVVLNISSCAATVPAIDPGTSA